ncbi:MFS general substrate transporter [Lepidopterella palustris CBS 459.81]|uniref:MFS general substrate transporter n=1 Tax=Lepidopterella palustris CBS 459.81 TaxID=1314670 RepID=A0A8E2E4W6_9PEZI|nr:MFS general substrate transporter [Lepidopterella palustris CBS 459.81]
MADPEKNGVDQIEAVPVDTGITRFEIDGDGLPPGYFRSAYFIGSMAAICLGFFGGVGGFALAAPILSAINEDIGPDPNIVWVALSFTLTSAVCITIVGRVSDIFGRRWVFIGGAICGVVGSIVCATAKDVTSLIAGTAIIGIAASTQLSYFYVMGELVPMKHRFAANSMVYFFQIPANALAPVISDSFIIYHPTVGWRGSYYLLVVVDSLALICWVLFYHPPTFHMKHRNESLLKYIKNFDYIGTTMYTGGLLILLMGLNWGGVSWPWSSARVIATIVVGFVTLVIFVLWETYMNLTEPLVPMVVFRNIPWNAATVLSGLGASIYYAFAIVWPQMVGTMYADTTSPIATAWLSSVSGLGWVFGVISGGLVARRVTHIKWQCVLAISLGGLFFGLVATCNPDTRSRACAFVAIGSCFVGWTESLAITAVTVTAYDQSELGSSGGVAGSIRYLITSIATTVYTVTLTNRQAQEIPPRVTSAVEAAGLPPSSVAAFIKALSGGASALDKVPGVTPRILAAGTRAYQEGNSSAFRTVFLSTIAFTGVALISALFLPDLEALMSNKVATTLGTEKASDSETESPRQ